jgi:hypothetical protein
MMIDYPSEKSDEEERKEQAPKPQEYQHWKK